MGRNKMLISKLKLRPRDLLRAVIQNRRAQTARMIRFPQRVVFPVTSLVSVLSVIDRFAMLTPVK